MKYRACRDNVPVATGALEARGGNGYIEDWPNARLVRDAHLGLLWEGTSNINALDAVQRAVGKAQAHEALGDDLPPYRRAACPASSARGCQRRRPGDPLCRGGRGRPGARTLLPRGLGPLYHATTATLMATEGQSRRAGGDARRLLLSRFVLEHRMKERGRPLTLQKWEEEATAAAFRRSGEPRRRNAPLAGLIRPLLKRRIRAWRRAREERTSRVSECGSAGVGRKLPRRAPTPGKGSAMVRQPLGSASSSSRAERD